MSFAVSAVSKALALAGLDHIVTEGGRIIVEAAYDGDRMVPALISVTKQGNTYIAKRSKKKLVKFREYQAKLMKARRAAGYSEKEAILAKKPHKKRPAQSKSAKKAWKSSPKLVKKHSAAEAKREAARKAAAERAAKILAKKKEQKAAKKTAAKKPAAKSSKVAPKKPVAKKPAAKPAAKKAGFGGKKRFG